MKYAPNFPTVAVTASFPGRIVSAEQLDELGLLAAREPENAPPLRASTSGSWPDYQRGATMKHAENAPDLGRADFMWSLLAAQRGHSIDDIASRLMEESSKAKENGVRYARSTAENAIAAVYRQRPKPHLNFLKTTVNFSGQVPSPALGNDLIIEA
jgi:hypothetical protein